MSSYPQVETVMALTNSGWEVLRFPTPSDGSFVVGAPVYLNNAQQDMLVVDSEGAVYPIDISLASAKKAYQDKTAKAD